MTGTHVQGWYRIDRHQAQLRHEPATLRQAWYIYDRASNEDMCQRLAQTITQHQLHLDLIQECRLMHAAAALQFLQQRGLKL
jgi:hypothetical protein